MADFESFNDEPESGPVALKPKYGNEQTAALPDADYDVEIVGSVMKEAAGKTIFTFLTVVKGGEYDGWKCEKAIFLEKNGGTDEEKAAYRAQRIQEIRADFKTLGFDSENWTKANGRPFGEQWKIACDVMKGLKVRVKKKKNGTFVNVYFNKRLADKDGRAATFGPADMVASEGMNAPPAAGTEGEPLPF
jgi:hypothetical protein